MSELQNNQGPQGRIDLPLPRQEEAARLQGPIVLDADDLAASQPWSEPPGDADSVVHRALGQRRIGLLGWGLAGVGLLSVVELGLFVWHTLADVAYSRARVHGAANAEAAPGHPEPSARVGAG